MAKRYGSNDTTTACFNLLKKIRKIKAEVKKEYKTKMVMLEGYYETKEYEKDREKVRSLEHEVCSLTRETEMLDTFIDKLKYILEKYEVLK